MVEKSATLPSCGAARAARRRRNKTVHFGDSFVYAGGNGGSDGRATVAPVAIRGPTSYGPPSSSAWGGRQTYSFPEEEVVEVSEPSPLASGDDRLQPNVQQLFTFIETVLSAWVEDTGGGGGDDGRGGVFRWRRRRRSGGVSGGSTRGPRTSRSRGGSVGSSGGSQVRRGAGAVSKPPLVVSHGRRDAAEADRRFAHNHWPFDSEECNTEFLRKVLMDTN